MLGKHYKLSTYVEGTNEARVKLANFDSLATQGNAIADFLSTFTPDPAYMYLHVIAMGAGEYYGCNINGDYFPERDLIAKHQTFTENAHVFKEHDNKPTSQSYGNVVFSWYNPVMHRVELILAIDRTVGREFVERVQRGEQLEVSMGCFPAGTLITLENNVRVPIERVTVGDKVLTHKGNIREVKTVMTYPYIGDLCTITCCGSPRPLTATSNHPLYVRRYRVLPKDFSEGKCPICSKLIKNIRTHILRKKDDAHTTFVKESYPSNSEFTDSWIPASEVKVGDYLLTPLPKVRNTTSCTQGLRRLLGYFIAEGNYVKYKGSPNRDNALLQKYCSKVKVASLTKRASFSIPGVITTTDYIARQVTNIFTEAVDQTPVYNLSVEGDESFVAEDAAVHNCRVKYDVCSICGNHASKKDEYCDHIKHELKKIYPDGKQVYMINVNPTFFDISIVRHRADKIAYVLDKVAHANYSSTGYVYPESEAKSIDQIMREISDWDIPQEKTANLAEDAIKMAMDKEITSEAVRVLNKDILASLPALEATEPDLPPAMLDRVATRYPFFDILKTFALNAIPLKPRELTRIIVIQQRLPMSSYNSVLSGVLDAPLGMPLYDGEYQPQITKFLDPFLMSRSSFLPAVAQRFEKVASMPLDLPGAVYDMNPALSMGQTRRVPDYTDISGPHYDYANIPPMYNGQSSAVRPPLKDPTLSPLQIGGALGAGYLAYKGTHLKDFFNNPKNAAIAGLLAVLAAGKVGGTLYDKLLAKKDPMVKQAGALGSFGTKVVAPVIGAHFIGAHYRNKYNHGENLNGIQRFLAENPDMTSVVGIAAAHMLPVKLGCIKEASIDNSLSSAECEKLAALADTISNVADTALSGIIFAGKGRSPLSSALMMGLDNKIMKNITPQS